MYARLSKNRDGRSQSVTVQLAKDREYFELRDWPVNDHLVFSDDNISASEYAAKERPGFLNMLAAIRDRHMWELVVTEVSRITRDMQVGMNLVKCAQEAGGLQEYRIPEY
jgi:DNA invertase Pin-like site-specific DNA recombinase